MRIEELWNSLRGETIAAQRRIDSDHPLDLYADFEPPDRPGLVLLCENRPPDFPILKAIQIERRHRQDGRWSLRVLLDEPKLFAVFGELCRDIVDLTRTCNEPERAGSIVLARIERWRSLLLMETGGLGTPVLRGLIGELIVLERHILPLLGPDGAVSAWTGPLGIEHDFRLPSGHKIEVKAVDRDAETLTINGLGQLDGGADSLDLTVVRLEETGHSAADAITARLLVERLRKRLEGAPVALRSFDALLSFIGWDDEDDTGQIVVRLVRIDTYAVDATFPRLTAATVPIGVLDVTYEIRLPSREVRL